MRSGRSRRWPTVLSGWSPTAKDKNYSEFHHGSFRRTVPPPVDTRAEDVTASQTDGVLEIRVPVKPKEAPASVTIPVTRGRVERIPRCMHQ